MLIAVLEPGQAMAIANFSLAIFFVFTISLPLLLITRSGKTAENREFLTATVNPWSQFERSTESSPVAVSGITNTDEISPKLELVTEQNIDSITESNKVISIDPQASEELIEDSPTELATNEEVLAA